MENNPKKENLGNLENQKTDEQKNTKKPIAIDHKQKIILLVMAAAACLIAYAAMNSIGKKKVTAANTEPQTSELTKQSQMMKNWDAASAKEDPLRIPTADPFADLDDETERQKTAAAMTEPGTTQTQTYPPIEYASANKDTLIWQRGLYKKIADVGPTTPDTIIVDGRKFIEIL